MPELISEQQVKRTRKPHRCHGCQEVIPPGSEATVSTCTDENIYTLYFCKTCAEWMKTKCSDCRVCYEWPNDGMMAGDIKNCMQYGDLSKAE